MLQDNTAKTNTNLKIQKFKKNHRSGGCSSIKQ